MPLSLSSFAASDTDYVQKLNANNAAIEAFVNALANQILAGVGAGADLVLDLWDRDGLVGSHSYVLDLENYAGGSQIIIGRRPAPVIAHGETDVSVAWGTFAGQRDRVELAGDLVLDAAPIVTGLPKTIYVVIPSNGTPQLLEVPNTPNVLYAYSLCWDGYSLTEFKRMAPILPAYSALQKIVGEPRILQIFDPDTDWLEDTQSGTEIVIPGDAEANGIDLDGAMEVLGIFVHFGRHDLDGLYADGGTQEEQSLVLKVMSEAIQWNLDPLEFDASNIPDTVMSKIDTGAVGDDRYVTETRRFTLERASIGGRIISARAFTWGLFVRPMIGIEIPIDTNKLNLI